jgi:hypothetical protein
VRRQIAVVLKNVFGIGFEILRAHASARNRQL